MRMEGLMQIMKIVCVVALLMMIAGCASKPAVTDESSKGPVAEQRGEMQVDVPSGEDGQPAAAPAGTTAKPFTAEEKASYLKIEAEFLCESMTKEIGEQQKLQDIAKKYGMTTERMEEIVSQLTRPVAMREVGAEATKICPEAFAPQIE